MKNLIIPSIVAFAVAFALTAPVVQAAEEKGTTPAVEEKQAGDDVSAAKNDKPPKSKKDKDKDGDPDDGNNGKGND